jgi:hypothetical protein
MLTEDKVNANLGNPFSWYNDNENILVKWLLKQTSIRREKLPTGPIVSNANGTASSNRTYQVANEKNAP